MNFGERLKQIRKTKGLSQQELADQLGVHFSHLNRMENGRAEPSFEVIKQLTDIFAINADYFFQDSDGTEPLIQNKNLAEKIRLISTLDDADQAALNHMMNVMLAKKRAQEFLQKPEEAGKNLVMT